MFRNVRIFTNSVKHFSTETNLVTSRLKPITIPQISLPELIWPRLEQWADLTAIVSLETGRSYTYRELSKKSLSFGKYLKKYANLKQNKSLGIILNNVPEYPIAFLGSLNAGVKVTTFNPNYTVDEFQRQLHNANVGVVVTSSDILPKVKKACDLPIIEVNDCRSSESSCIKFEEICNIEADSQIYKSVDLQDTIVIPYSSGTTGLPKGVELTHYNFVSVLSQLVLPLLTPTKLYDGKQDVVPAIVPLFHIFGMVSVMLLSLMQGGKLVTMKQFSFDNYIALLKKHRPDVLYVPPPLILATINHPNIKSEDLSSLRTILSGAAPLAASDLEKLKSKTNHNIDLLQGFGMTETTGVISVQTAFVDNCIKPGGVGILLPNTEARIISIDSGKITNLGPNQQGELICKSPTNMKGYYNDEENTKNTFLEDGWLLTGDVGYYDEDKQFFITDRLKELIKVKGFQVAPAELESVLREHPNIEDAAVIGVPHSYNGEAPKAFIVAKKNANLTTKEVEAFIANKLSKHKHLHGGIMFIGAIPKSPAGKILRNKLKEL